MKKSIVCAAAMLLLASGAFAQGVKVKGVVGGGVTFGGDTLADVPYEHSSYGSDNVKVHAGGLLAANVGVELQYTDMWSTQFLVGYHVDRTSGSNGSVRFERYPVELLAHARMNSWFRLGGGLRYTNAAKTRVSGVGANYAFNEDFKPAYGVVVEGEFLPFQNWGFKLRYVSEKFKSKTYPGLSDVDGSHGGMYVNYYF